MAIVGADGKPLKTNGRATAFPRRVAGRYDAAQTHDLNALYWRAADALDADAANSLAVRKRLRERARYEVANSCYLAAQVSTRVAHEVLTGPTLLVQTASPGLNGMIAARWAEWAQAADLAETLRTLCRARIVDGEAFGQIITRRDLLPAIGLHPIECDRVTAPRYQQPSDRYVDGIVLDDLGLPLRYQVLVRHPGSAARGSLYDYVEVPARLMVHLFRPTRPGQHRGVPEVTPALMILPGIRQYIAACIKARLTAASISVVFETDLPPGEEPDELEPGAVDIPIGTMFQAPTGWKAKQISAEHPDENGQAFIADRVAEAGRALMLPRNLATGDSSNYNFASGRLDHQPYFADITITQQTIVQRVLDPLFGQWYRQAVVDFEWTLDPERPPAHTWRWPGQPYTDPEAEANAIATNLRSGVTTLPAEYARRGLNWDEELNRQAEALGLTPEALKARLVEVLYPTV